MDVSETLLPGVGMRYEFVTASGQQIGMIVHRDGRTEILGFRADDPDASRLLLELDDDEAAVLAELLGAPRFSRKLADLTREIPGLNTATIVLPSTSRFVGETLGGTRLRSRTGVSVVALIRGDEVMPSPATDRILLAGDTLIVIGTKSGITDVRELIGEANDS